MNDVDLEVREIEAMRAEIERRIEETHAPRWNPDPEEVRKSVMKLVLTLVEFVRQLMERQAIRRVERETLTDEEMERVGLALMHLEETITDLATQAGLEPGDLNLDLGPLGKLI